MSGLKQSSCGLQRHIRQELKLIPSLGPLYYANVTVAGTSVEAMVDPGSSATIMSFELFRNIGAKAKIPVEALKQPDVALQDYSQRPIPIGACVDLELEWQGKSVTTTVYLRSDLGAQDEPYLLGTNVVIPLGLMVPGGGVEPLGRLVFKGSGQPSGAACTGKEGAGL